jgi:hypothetical protein
MEPIFRPSFKVNVVDVERVLPEMVPPVITFPPTLTFPDIPIPPEHIIAPVDVLVEAALPLIVNDRTANDDDILILLFVLYQYNTKK